MDNSKLVIVIKAGLSSALFTIIIDLIWFGLKICWLDNQAFLEPTGVVLAVYGALWANYLLPTQSTFAQTSKKRNALNAAIRADDEAKFLRYVDVQISWVTDLVFMTTCAGIMLMTFLIRTEVQEGLIIISIISWIFAFTRIMYLLRDNPVEGVWLLTPFAKIFRIGIWKLDGLPAKWRQDVLKKIN